MNIKTLIGAVALGLTMLPGAALADDPRDPSMRSAAARARDAATIRRLNREELARTQARDAQYAAGWKAYRNAPGAQDDYQRDLARWRRAVELCEAGRYEYCAR